MEAFGIVGPYIGGSLVNVFDLFHPFGGVVDIIVVEQKDGSYKSSPWYVRFGKFVGVLKAKEKIVIININGLDLDINMYLDHNGRAYFLHESNGDEGESMVSPSSGYVSNENRKIRAFIPTSEQLAILHLKEGKNMVTFISSTKMLGRQQVDARIYLWRWDTRIVISDVDGTITRSDVLGQVMPWVGVDWTQTGVTHLFTAIKENGYQLLFLSARAISQAYLTRQFLFNIKQDGKSLPDGPVVISPNGVFPSLYREVVRRAPHEFKIACLEDIKALFPSDSNPFYAGFGNRDTDELSYLKVGIPMGKIFIINPKGEIVVNRHHNAKSYTSLHGRLNGVFPPTSTLEQEEFNSWNFWKLPSPVLLDWTKIVV